MVKAAEGQAEIDEPYADTGEEAHHEVVDPHGEVNHVVDVVGGRPAEGRHVLFAHQRVGEIIGTQVELDDGTRQHRAFLERELLRELAGAMFRTMTSTGSTSTS